MRTPAVSSVIIPEFSVPSDATYEMYPKQKIIIDSITGFFENILNRFSTQALSRAKIIPINRDLNARVVKSPIIVSGVPAVIGYFFVVNLSTALNKIIDTASFVIPSPNTILNSLGCCA